MTQLVRAHWVSGAAVFLKMQFTSDVSERLLAGLPRELQLALRELQPGHWCPRSYHVELMNAIASAHDSPVAAYDDLVTYGQYVGSEMINGSLRSFMQIVNLKLFAKKLPAIWARDHQDDSRLESDISLLEEGRLPLRVCNVRGYNHVGVAMLGWVKSATSRFVRRAVHVKQTGWTVHEPAPAELGCEVSWS